MPNRHRPRRAPTAPGASADAQAPEEPIGNVATVVGNATVTRNDAAIPLKVKDEIYLNDVVQTSAKSSLGITFNDATTFNLTANAKITIDNFVYEDGGKNNAALFEVAKGTVAFVAAAVAKTGDMKISTPTATLGIRGTSGVVEVPEGAAANSPGNVAIKLYPDADGKVGRIEVNDRAGLRLGFLSQGASGFTIRAGSGGARFAAVPLTISPQQMLRDQGFVRQVHSTQNLGSRVVTEQRAFRRANPGFSRGNAPRRGPQQNGLPGRKLTGQQPGLQNRPGQQQPGLQNRPRQQQAPGQQNRPGQQQLQTGRVNCNSRARLTGRVSNCSGRDPRLRFAAGNRIAATIRTTATAGDGRTTGITGAPAIRWSATFPAAAVRRNCAAARWSATRRSTTRLPARDAAGWPPGAPGVLRQGLPARPGLRARRQGTATDRRTCGRLLAFRHARPCAGHPRLACDRKQDVDGRDKPGHDEMNARSRRAAKPIPHLQMSCVDPEIHLSFQCG